MFPLFIYQRFVGFISLLHTFCFLPFLSFLFLFFALFCTPLLSRRRISRFCRGPSRRVKWRLFAGLLGKVVLSCCGIRLVSQLAGALDGRSEPKVCTVHLAFFYAHYSRSAHLELCPPFCLRRQSARRKG